MSLLTPPVTGHVYHYLIVAPFVETLDPLTPSGDPPGSKTTRQFFYGVGLFCFGGGLLDLGG